MAKRRFGVALIRAALAAAGVAVLGFQVARAQEEVLPSPVGRAAGPAPGVVRLSLQDAKQQALANSKLLKLAGHYAQEKAWAIAAAQTDYFPHVMGNVVYMHFSDDL